MIVKALEACGADAEATFLLTGAGDVFEPEDGVIAVGSGGNFALSAARALMDYEDDPEIIVRKAMEIAAQKLPVKCRFVGRHLMED